MNIRSSIDNIHKNAGVSSAQSYLVYGGDQIQNRSVAHVLPWEGMDNVLWQQYQATQDTGFS